jgi:opacity protein-like surface antigen
MAVLAAANPLSAQEVVTSTAGDTQDQAETPPEFTPSIGAPLMQTSPDDGTLRAGAELVAPESILGRRMKLSTSLVGGYDDNVNLAPTASPSWFANPGAVFSYQFGNPHLAMDLTAGAGITYYFSHPGGRDYDPNIYLRLFLAYKATARLTLDLAAFASYQAQPDVTSSLSANRRLGNFFRSQDSISAHYRWTPRFSTVTSYSFSALEYTTSSASSLDRLENRFGEDLRYLLFPTTTATAGYRFNITDYQNKPSNQNSASNPITQTFTVGLDQTFSPHLTGIFQGGVQLRSGQPSPYVGAALHYVFDPERTTSESSTFVIWTNRYSIEESDVAAGSGRQTFRTNLLLNYGISARISANLAVSYLHATGSIGNGLNAGLAGGGENLFDVSPGVRYAITPKLSVNVGYRHTELSRGSASSIALQSLGYTRNRYFAGLNISF